MAKNEKDQNYWLNIKKEAQAIRNNLVSLKNVYAKTNLETTGSPVEKTIQELSKSSFDSKPIGNVAETKIQPALTRAQIKNQADSQMEPTQSNLQSTKTDSLQTQTKPQPIQFKVQSSLTLAQNIADPQGLMSVKAKQAFDMFEDEKKFYEQCSEDIDSNNAMLQTFEHTQKANTKNPSKVNKSTKTSTSFKSKPKQQFINPRKESNITVQETAPNVYTIIRNPPTVKFNTTPPPKSNWLIEVPTGKTAAKQETKTEISRSIKNEKPVPATPVVKHETKAEISRPVPKNETPVPATPSTAAKEESQPQGYSANRRNQYPVLQPRAYPSGIPRSFLRQNPQDYQHLIISEHYQYGMPSNYSNATTQLTIQTQQSTEEDKSQQYSPSNVYEDTSLTELQDDHAEPTETYGQKRLSAFQRLGPMSEPKKPKLTINLLCSEDQSVREVVDLTDKESEKYEDVHLRDDVLKSTNEIVKRYLPMWPWQKNIAFRKSATARASKNVMLLQLEQMEEIYDRDYAVICVSVIGYPPEWNKEDVLDAILDTVKGKTFIPLYIDFKLKECRFLVMKCKAGLVAIHKLGFYIRKKDVELKLTLSLTDCVTNSLSIIPKVVLKEMLSQNYDGERKLSLKEFALGSDISSFLYFPLNSLTNQSELLELKSDVVWEYITDLDLSGNRLTSLDGFNLPKTMPRLQNLDLTNNYFEKLTVLLKCRTLNLRSIKLEGNPLCIDYTDPTYYVKVLRMIFPSLKEIDGIPIQFSGEIPKARRNYCVPDAKEVVEKFLDTYFPLLESLERKCIANMYSENAVLSVTYRNSLRSSGKYIYSRSLFNKSRVLKEGDLDCIEGATAIGKHISKWPPLVHDPYSFTVDVMHHDDSFTVLRVGGMMKLTSESLADDEYMIAFTRTIVLHTSNGVEYKIKNEMVFWDEPSSEWVCRAFQRNTVKKRRVSFQFESVPDKEMQNSLVQIFMKITELDEKASCKCLEVKDWNFKEALQHFIKILKLDGVECLRS